MLETAHQQVVQLIEDFKTNSDYYLSPSYTEAAVRQDFIDKFFTALGWDVAHNHQKNPYQQEVKVEKAQRQEGSQAQKRADYAFHLAPDYRTVQFFVEAKKPSRTLRKNQADYFQTAKYGWNSQTGVSVLTDFEEFVIIDCRHKPDFDTALSTEIKYYTYTDFLNQDTFAEVFWLFSREAVAAGNLQAYISNLPKPKGKSGKQGNLFGGGASIDDSFLEYIDEIRLQMAQAFYTGNPNLDNYQLTEATQRTIDRLVFMRFLEDKQIEPENLLHNIANAAKPWKKFIAECRRLDTKYNGIVFKPHFMDKDGFLGADEAQFREIAADLDHTNTPYDFNYIPIHILGNIYERFLGKVISIQDGKACVEEKPEVRKAGGVFYTPKYIVDYIVEHTVGPLLEKARYPSKVAELKIADISCGSGSFLIGVYGKLLDWYRSYYNQYPTAAKEAGCHWDEENGVWVLSIRQKQQILLDNVYGTDIDMQAAEVTQVSLFLKLLEDETMVTANEMNVLFAEKILPDLSGNIKCGNALIGYDIMDNLPDFDRSHQRSINPFEFEQAFPKVFRRPQKGFDAIVGNPPYVKVSSKEQKDQRAYFEQHYQHQNYQYDLYLLFLERSGALLAENGKIGMIVPNTWLQSLTYTEIRRYLLNDYRWQKILHGKEHIFDAVVDTHVLIFEKGRLNGKNLFDVEMAENCQISSYQRLDQNHFDKQGGIINILATPEETTLFEKIKKQSIALQDCTIVYNGVKPFEKGKGNPPQSKETVKDKPYVKEDCPKPEGENWKPLMRGSLMNKYISYWNEDSWIQYGEWLAAPRQPEIFSAPEKIIVRQTADRIIATLIGKDIICRNNLHILISEKVNQKFILAVLNSKLTDFCYYQLNPESGEALAEVKKAHVEQLLLPKVNQANQTLHDQLVKLADQMLQAKQNAKTAETESDQTFYNQHITFLDDKINQTVYQMYGLNDAEIALIEKRVG